MVILGDYSLKKTPQEESVKSSQELSKGLFICLSESVRRGPILSGCDSYWGLVWDTHADADKNKKKDRLDRVQVNKSEDNL